MPRQLNTARPEFFRLCPYALERREQSRLTKALTFLTLLALLSFPAFGAPIESILGAALILIAAVIPFFLWSRGAVLGLPIFPLYALTLIITHTYPLISLHPTVVQYTPEEQLSGAAKVALFLLCGTIVWFMSARRLPRVPYRYYAMDQRTANSFFIYVLLGAIVYQAAFVSGGIWRLPDQFISILRAVLLGLNLLGAFYLSYAIGSRKITKFQTYCFLTFFPIYIMTTALSLLLINIIWPLLLAFIGFTLGSKRVPWKSLIVVTVIVAMLHAGKGDMRVRYWYSSSAPSTSITDLPARLSEWVGSAIRRLELVDRQSELQLYTPQDQQAQASSLFERASIIHLLLLVQRKAGTEKPFLYGATYALIPFQMIPRFLLPGKVTPLQGTRILNVHYGLQKEEDTYNTTISWGLVNEAYANFGITGLIGLGILLGYALAQAARWCLFTPVLSARTLFGVVIMAMFLQTELSAGTLVASLFQTSVVLLAVTYGLMKRYSLVQEEEELENT